MGEKPSLKLLKGRTVLLAPIGAHHAALVAAWKNNAEVRRCALSITRRLTVKSQRDAIQWAIATGTPYFLILAGEKRQPIGYIRADWQDENYDYAILRYAIGSRKNRGRGYGRDAVKTLAAYLFANGIRRLEAEVYDFNAPNITLLESLGFALEGSKRQAHLDTKTGRYHDVLLFGLLRQEFNPKPVKGTKMKLKNIILAAALTASAACVQAAPQQKPHTRTGNVNILSIPEFLEGRNLWVYLPPGYEQESGRRYPVLYLQDGQNLFDEAASFAGEWQVDETCERMIKSGELPPFIVVGIENDGTNRVAEYTPWKDPKEGGGKGSRYLKAVQSTLIPAINARYRTLPGPDNTFIGGSSLGGLISAYAGYSRPDIWGGVLAVSPTYWWDNNHFTRWAGKREKPALLFFYQDMGTGEDGSDPGRTGFIQMLRDVKAVALKQGFREGKDFFSVESQGDGHNEKFWAKRLPDMLKMTIGKFAVKGTKGK